MEVSVEYGLSVGIFMEVTENGGNIMKISTIIGLVEGHIFTP